MRMKVFVLLFGIFAFMLNITLSSMLSIKKCRKLLTTSSYVTLSNSSTKDQTSDTDKPTEKTCNNSAPVVTIEQNKEPLSINISTWHFIKLKERRYLQQYIDPPFAPPRQEKYFSRNLF